MKFHGLIKSTLVDYPNNVACTLFTGGCNFRCPFCQNSSLVLNPQSEPTLDEDELVEFLKKRRKYLDGVCITGGEPLLQDDVVDFCKFLKSLGYKIKLDTNGSFPKKLKKLLDLNLLDYIAMDIKNSKTKYAKTIGSNFFDLEVIEKSVELIKTSNVDHEFRTTIVREFHTLDDLIEIAKWLGKDEKYYLQTFEDRGSNIATNLHPFTIDEEQCFLNELKSYIGFVEVRGI